MALSHQKTSSKKAKRGLGSHFFFSENAKHICQNIDMFFRAKGQLEEKTQSKQERKKVSLTFWLVAFSLRGLFVGLVLLSS